MVHKSIRCVTLLLSVGGMLAQALHSVDLKWSASATPGVTYTVWRKTKTTPFVQVNTSPVAALSFTDNAVVSGTTYYYSVSAELNGRSSNKSNIVGVTVP